jgi:hypothetical protein
MKTFLFAALLGVLIVSAPVGAHALPLSSADLLGPPLRRHPNRGWVRGRLASGTLGRLSPELAAAPRLWTAVLVPPDAMRTTPSLRLSLVGEPLSRCGTFVRLAL